MSQNAASVRQVTPEDVLSLESATEAYLCPLSANTYNIEFLGFKLRDIDSEVVLFEVRKPPEEELPPDCDESSRFIRYNFPAVVLNLRNVGATIEFSVGDKSVSHFRMIERHYFRNHLIKSFDFDFGFCMPNTTNTCEQIYEMPELSPQEMKEMVEHPYETKSDSFYFVEGKLVMHHKADYAFNSDGSQMNWYM